MLDSCCNIESQSMSKKFFVIDKIVTPKEITLLGIHLLLQRAPVAVNSLCPPSLRCLSGNWYSTQYQRQKTFDVADKIVTPKEITLLGIHLLLQRAPVAVNSLCPPSLRCLSGIWYSTQYQQKKGEKRVHLYRTRNLTRDTIKKYLGHFLYWLVLKKKEKEMPTVNVL